MNDNKILVTLRTPNATLGVLALALAAQIPHAADVFRLIVQGDSWWSHVHSYLYAVALEMAVLLFVVKGRHKESYGFAVASVLINLSYYHLHSVWLFSWLSVPAWLVSIALPIAIARYSHVVVEVKPPVQAQKQPVQRTAKPVQAKKDDAQVDKKARARQLHSEGLSNVQIGKEIGVVHTTVGRWLKATNGAHE